MNPTEMAYFSHIRFLAEREGWPPFSDEEIHEAFERCEQKLAYWREQARLRRPPADEVTQGLPSLIAGDMKKRGLSITKELRPVKTSIEPVVKPQAPQAFRPAITPKPLGSVPLP